MSTDVSTYEPGRLAAQPEPPTVTYMDPTGGRLVRWAEAASAAHALAKSLCQTAFVPRTKGPNNQMVPMSVGDATAAILMGDELGMSPLAALRSIYVVHGTPALYARSMVALAQSHGHEIWTEESTPAKVTVCGRRRGSEHVERSTWTPDRARKAGYTGNKKYDTSPQEMLYSKAAAEVARKIAADVLAGVAYSVEDLELEQPATRTVTRSESKPRTVQRAKAPEPVEPELDDEPAPAEDTAAEGEPAPDGITQPQLRKLGALMREAGLTDRDAALAFVTETIGRPVESRNDLTKVEAGQVIDALEPLIATDAGTDDAGWAGEGQ